MKLLTVIFLTLTVAAAQDLPVIGTINELNGLTKVYIATASTDSRKMIVKQMGKKSGLEIVDDPKDAEFILEYIELSRQAKSGLFGGGGNYTEQGEMRAWLTRPDGTKVIAWSDTETYYESGGMPTGKSNEMNLTKNFMRDLKKARTVK